MGGAQGTGLSEADTGVVATLFNRSAPHYLTDICSVSVIHVPGSRHETSVRRRAAWAVISPGNADPRLFKSSYHVSVFTAANPIAIFA